VYRDDTSPEVPTGSPVNWSTHQLTAFLAAVSAAEDERTVSRLAVERAAEALAADLAALMRRGEVVASVGSPNDATLQDALAEVADGSTDRLFVPGHGDCPALAIEVEDDDAPTSLVVARGSGDGFTADELELARGMASVLGLSVRLFRVAAAERRQRREAETQSELNQRLLDSLQERQVLLERLARIQRSITHGAVRQEVLEAICQGARELLGDEVAALELIPPDDPSVLELVAMTGPDATELREARIPRSSGVAGRAMADGRLVVSEDYQADPGAAKLFARRGIRAAMAAPVHELGRPVGSLIVASYRPGRRYSTIERDMLVAFADHASLALSDSRSIEAMREADAARSQARFRSLVNSSSDMITVIDSARRIIYVSPSVERTVAPPPDGLEGARLVDLLHPDDRRRAVEFLAAVARGGSAPSEPVEWRVRGIDGGWIEVETIATGLLDDPDVQGIVLNSRVVTERKRLEAALRQSQRLESVGQLAGGIAHDFNNLLSVIRGYARFLVDGFDEGDARREDAAEIENAAQRAAALTAQLLIFSRRDVVPLQVVDVAEVLRGISVLLARTLGEDIVLHTRVDGALPFVEADPTQLEQVLMNLAVNARDAMPSGGELHIGLAAVEEDDEPPAVRLTVRDTGEGMKPEVVERAFEPFFSTKPKGQGTGLGLATVYGIVTQAGGTIEIQSTPGEGTTVEVVLPATDATPHSEPAPSEDESDAARRETILVVEDEDAVRRLTCRILSGAGYRVLEAADGADALARWEEHPGEIDLLLTDVVMPGMSGRQLAERLETDPVFMSGYTDDVVLRHGLDGVRLVQKPFDEPTLLGAIRSALDA
jgi:two-component system cell cycle sensor histidine kinase/response regulator CckA